MIQFHASKTKPLIQSAVTFAIIFLSIIICIGFLGHQAQKINREHLDQQLKIIAENAAALIDGDLHDQLIAEGETGTELYKQMIEPLVKLHNVTPNIYYLYTMKDTGDKLVYGLDTAWSPDLKSNIEDLEAEDVAAVYDVSEEDYRYWADRVRLEGTHVDEEFIVDDTGNFITASAPFFNEAGEYVGFVGVDIDPPYFFAHKNSINRAMIYVCLLGTLLSFIIAFITYRNQSAIEGLQQDLYDKTIKDALTGSYNRRFFEHRLKASEQTYSAQNKKHSIALLDIDHFKSVNDNYGHDVGDTVLREIAELVRANVRQNDDLFRYGGEEFVVLFDGSDIAVAKAVADRFMTAVREYSFANKHDLDLRITMSVGIAEATSEQDILKAADISLYEAKDNGRDQIVLAA